MQQSPSLTLETKAPRLVDVDALRGFALLAIVVLHCIEHYNLYWLPEWQPEWLNRLDSMVTSAAWFFMAGKAYATFSLLFGFSFYIQLRNARLRGEDFRLRFAWRMLMLACIAQLHALFYNGDILVFYAVCGLILIPAASWSNRTVLIVATALLVQPIDWIHMLTAAIDPGYTDLNSLFVQFAGQAEQVAMHGNLLETLADNIGNGQLYSNFWQFESGRITQAPGLFLIGMWLGRKEYFVKSEQSKRFWKRLLFWSVVVFFPLYFLKTSVIPQLTQPTWVCHYGIATGLPLNFVTMSAMVALFMIFWFRKGEGGYGFQHLTVNYGRMSLTNYVTQSVIGVSLFYNYGGGLYQYCGATLSTVIAFVIVGLQIAWSNYWIKTYGQGPLEWIWKKLTWIGSDREKGMQPRPSV